MNNESKFWSVVTAISLVLLIFIAAKQANFSVMDIFSSEEKDEIIEDETNETSELTNSSLDPDPISRECLDHDGLARHDHAVLKIFIDGEQELIPANIGIMTDI